MSLGLESGKNQLVPYSGNWPQLYTAEADRIRKACTGVIVHIEHVGSTAVPGLLAKPIIDICVSVRSLEHAESMLTDMQKIGYDYPGDIGIPGERIFGRDKGKRLFLVHVVVADSPEYFRYLAFRDLLIQRADLASEYGDLKRRLAEAHPEGRAIYTKLKSEFINRALLDCP